MYPLIPGFIAVVVVMTYIAKQFVFEITENSVFEKNIQIKMVKTQKN